MDCKCYRAERNFLGKVGVCWGTKEREACSCGGDESKCDFYEDKRKKAALKTTNGDLIRSMSDDELADFLSKSRGGCRALTTESYVCDYYYDDNLNTDCHKCWFDWLNQEVEK